MGRFSERAAKVCGREFLAVLAVVETGDNRSTSHPALPESRIEYSVNQHFLATCCNRWQPSEAIQTVQIIFRLHYFALSSMNSIRRPYVGRSKATPNTVCQKCLKRDMSTTCPYFIFSSWRSHPHTALQLRMYSLRAGAAVRLKTLTDSAAAQPEACPSADQRCAK